MAIDVKRKYERTPRIKVGDANIDKAIVEILDYVDSEDHDLFKALEERILSIECVVRGFIKGKNS